MITTFTCEYCGQEFNNEKQCADHEMKHIKEAETFASQIHMFDSDYRAIITEFSPETLHDEMDVFFCDTSDAILYLMKKLCEHDIRTPTCAISSGDIILWNDGHWRNITREKDGLEKIINAIKDQGGNENG